MAVEKAAFDLTLAQECAKAFGGASGLGCVISKTDGGILGEYGYGCQRCELCETLGLSRENCVQAQNYGMTEAERFGGKYIYYCPRGLTCFVSPILGEVKSAAKITAGPFLMVERQDFIGCELNGLTDRLPDKASEILRVLDKVPVVSTERIQQLSTLLFMAVGFLNNVSAANRMHTRQRSDAIQGQISGYISQLKSEEAQPYPLSTEKALLRSIAKTDKEEAHRLLNKLLGHIFFTNGGDFAQTKERLSDLLVLMGRATVDAGANAQLVLRETAERKAEMSAMRDMEALCAWLARQMNDMMDHVFQFTHVRHANAIHRCVQYLEMNYAEKISLEQMAHMVYLSPSYLSRVFAAETGASFNSCLNRIRVEKSKELLLHGGLRIADISGAVGFEDQSYFTKVFKRIVGVTPNQYRDTLRF